MLLVMIHEKEEKLPSIFLDSRLGTRASGCLEVTGADGETLHLK